MEGVGSLGTVLAAGRAPEKTDSPGAPCCRVIESKGSWEGIRQGLRKNDGSLTWSITGKEAPVLHRNIDG